MRKGKECDSLLPEPDPDPIGPVLYQKRDLKY